jgi:hypothetical protein
LVKKGLLRGKKDKKAILLEDDEALARAMQLGVEQFVQGQQGYSFMAVRAPIEQAAAALKARPGVAKYQAAVKPLKMKEDLQAQPDAKCRHVFLVQMADAPDCSVLIQTVHWFHSCDAIMATALAAALSKDLKTVAAAAWDDDFSGSSLIICENGKQKAAVSEESEEEEGGWENFYEFFYEQGISLPHCFIATTKAGASLHVADPAEVRRADYAVLKVPGEVKSKGAHVFEKFGMMAEAISEGLDDEEAFMKHMRGGIWQQAQAVLAAGKL